MLLSDLEEGATFQSVSRKKIETYCRSGFDYEILLIANCEFSHNSQSKELQLKEYTTDKDVVIFVTIPINIIFLKVVNQDKNSTKCKSKSAGVAQVW